jgi:hypothetical protein
MDNAKAVTPEPSESGEITIELTCGTTINLPFEEWRYGNPIERRCEVCGEAYTIVPLPSEDLLDAIESRGPRPDSGLIVLITPMGLS